MEGKRYSFIGSIKDLVTAIVKGGRDNNISAETEKLSPEAKSFVEKLLKRRDAFVNQLISNLNGGGTSAKMDLAVEMQKNENHAIKNQSMEKSDGFERVD